MPFFIVFFLRRPHDFLYPIFHLEDGQAYFLSGYIHPLLSFLERPTSLSGTVPCLEWSGRFCVLISILFPLHQAPLIVTIVATCLMILPCIFFMSDRGRAISRNELTRLVICLIFVLLPNIPNTQFVALSSRFFVSLLAFLLLVLPAQTKKGKWLDIILIVFTTLSGVFFIHLFIVFVLFLFFRPQAFKQRKAFFLMFFIACMIQMSFFLQSTTDLVARKSTVQSLGANLTNLTHIVAGDIVLGAFTGTVTTSHIINSAFWNSDVFPFVLFLFWIYLSFYAFRNGGFILRLFIIYAGLIAVSSLVAPLTRGLQGATEWEAIEKCPIMDRYYFFPIIAWITVIIYSMIEANDQFTRIIATVFFIGLCTWAIPNSFKSFPMYALTTKQPESYPHPILYTTFKNYKDMSEKMMDSAILFENNKIDTFWVAVYDNPGWTFFLKRSDFFTPFLKRLHS